MNNKSARSERYLAVELSHVDLTRGGRRVLQDLRWRIRPGQRWVLLGENGAGKTQLLKLIAGDVWPQPRPNTLRRYRWRGESSVEPYLVKEEIAYLGGERQDRFQHYERNHRVDIIVGTGIERTDAPLRTLNATERQRVARLLKQVGMADLARRRFLTLSQGERRLVLLARALAWRPKLLLLDEPLNGLDAPHRARILSVLGALSRSRLPWIYASHRPEEVPTSTTHCAKLSQGRLRTSRWPRQASRASSVAAPRSMPAVRGATQPALIELRRASVWRAGRAVLKNLSLRIRRGECWLVHGANGSGKSTFLATLYGEHGVASTGAIWRRDHVPGSPLFDYMQHVGCVSPELQAALPRAQSAQDCVIAGLRGAYLLDGASSASERDTAGRALRQVGAQRLAQHAFGELSYGQARRIVFARAQALRPDIVLLDEPYTGLDAASRRRLHSLIEAQIRAGGTIVIASHHEDDRPQGVTHELELDGGVALYAGPLRRNRRARGVPRV